jgi:ATP-dependent Clp protease, protease subunit
MKTATINMKSDGVTEVLVYDQIGKGFFGDGIGAKEFRDQIKSIKGKTINLRINSPGGDVFEASAMVAALDQYAGEIIVDIDGLAASAASVLAMAGDKIRISSNGMLMIHNPHSVVMGGAEEMRRKADTLDKVKGQIIDNYERRVKDRAKIEAWMAAETWFTGQEAIDAGFADEVTGSVGIAAFVSLDKIRAQYKRAPTPKPPPGPTFEQLAATRKRIERVKALRLKGSVAAAMPAADSSSADLLNVPDVPQQFDYDCGAAVTASVCEFFSVPLPDYQQYIEQLGTTPERGTDVKRIVGFLIERGLAVTAAGDMDEDDLQRFFTAGQPVICPVQDYGTPADETANRSGHYVVVVGVGLGQVFLRDPSFARLVKDTGDESSTHRIVSIAEFLADWHDVDADGRRYVRFGIAVGTEPPGELADEESLDTGEG